MAFEGYSRAAASRQTGLGREQCRCIFQRVSLQGYPLGRQGRLRSSLTLMRNREEKLQVSLLMVLYCVLGGEDVYKAIQLPALRQALQRYRSIQQTHLMTHWKNLDITDAWSLARELLRKEAYIKACPSCGIPNFTSVNQYTSVGCPFCPTY